MASAVTVALAVPTATAADVALDSSGTTAVGAVFGSQCPVPGSADAPSAPFPPPGAVGLVTTASLGLQKRPNLGDRLV